MGNSGHGAIVTNFMTTLQSIDYNKFERFSNVPDEISAKLLSSFLECEALVVVPDRYDFEFSVNGTEKKNAGQITHVTYRKLKLLKTKKF